MISYTLVVLHEKQTNNGCESFLKPIVYVHTEVHPYLLTNEFASLFIQYEQIPTVITNIKFVRITNEIVSINNNFLRNTDEYVSYDQVMTVSISS